MYYLMKFFRHSHNVRDRINILRMRKGLFKKETALKCTEVLIDRARVLIQNPGSKTLFGLSTSREIEEYENKAQIRIH